MEDAILKEFVTRFYKAFIDNNDEELVKMLTDDVHVNGVYNEVGKEAIRRLQIFLQGKKYSVVINEETLKTARFDVHKKAEDVFEVVCRFKNNGDKELDLSYYIVLEILKEKECKIKNIIFSLGAIEEKEAKEASNQIKLIVEENQKHAEELNRNIKTIYNTVPGGIFKCSYDEKLTLLEVSNGFLSMIGYTREEISKELGNSLRKIINDDDFEETKKVIDEQLREGNTKVIEYRLYHKDGHPIWVLDKGQLIVDDNGNKYFHCIVVDVTNEKIANDELRLSVERNQIIMNQTNDVIFEWDMQQNTIVVSNNWFKKFKTFDGSGVIKLPEIISGTKSSLFHIEDVAILKNSLKEMDSGKPYVQCEIRLLNKDDEYIWCRLRTTVQKDADGKPTRGIGIIIDIDQEKKKSQNLLEKATRDSLTGMFNKSVTEELISEYIKMNRETIAVLLIVDIDDFKIVNDTMGHLYGDALLTGIAKTMKELFRESDILGRIGGDEFMIFIKDVKSVESAKENAERIVSAIKKIRLSSEDEGEISCSIGVSVYPSDGSDFNTLYQNADYALYQAKKDGKNRYAFYDEKNADLYAQLLKSSYTPPVAAIDSNSNSSFEGDLAEYIYRTLYRSENIIQTIETVLSILGNRYDVSRVYIFENSEEDTKCCNTFEWCNEGVTPQIDNLKEVDYEEDLGGCYYENFNEKSIFYCPDIRELHPAQYEMLNAQGIKSMLQSAIRDNGKFKGFVGFDENDRYRYWTQEQIDVLSLISEIIATFLLKYRKEEKYINENNVLMSILDHQNAFIYIIDAKTYELKYFNKKTKETAQNVELGMHCHSLFAGIDTPCSYCPAKMVSKENPNATIEFYNENLKLWTDADASYIHWNGEEAILLVCHDISRFKGMKK